MITDEEAAAIQERLSLAPKRSRLITRDVPALLADRTERTRLLLEILERGKPAHEPECDPEVTDECDCGLDSLLAEIQEAVK